MLASPSTLNILTPYITVRFASLQVIHFSLSIASSIREVDGFLEKQRAGVLYVVYFKKCPL